MTIEATRSTGSTLSADSAGSVATAASAGSAGPVAVAASASERWCRTPGTHELGRTQDSGLREPSYLLRRGDGQVLQVSELLRLVVREVSVERDATQVAAAVSDACGRELTVDGLHRLVTTKLGPMGLVQRRDQPPRAARPAPRADPLLALRMRGTLLPVRTVRACARVMAPLFHVPVVVAALLGLVAVDVTLVHRGDLLAALVQVLATPVLLLAMAALLAVGALVHELGHAAACAYGGARPGVIGFGVYLMFPAFFTNVTDSYRLDRAGRLRTDLGGLYLNVWCVIALGTAYLTTGQGLFLLAALLMHVEMAQQLVPTVRFDGYFVLADIAGVPDLFARVRPVLRSMLPGRATDPRVSELRPAARRIVLGWVLVVVPLLAGTLGWLLYNLPVIVGRTAGAIAREASAVSAAWQGHDPAAFLLALLSILLLCVPLLGLALLAQQVLVRCARRLLPTRMPAAPGAPAARPEEATVTESDTTTADTLSAAALTDDAMLGPGAGPPSGTGWRRAVYRASAGRIDPGPSPAERRRAATLARVSAPIAGTRRVVVMSRKGGVGKTTITLALGSTYATLRGDRVVAVDANPDAGNLAHRVSRPCSRTITDLIDEIGMITSYSDLRGYTAQAPESRLEVLASDDDPRIGLALDRQAYHGVIDLLDHYYNLILLDTGTGILDSANQGLLSEADQLVLVLRPAVDGARAAGLTLDWLGEHGYGELVARAVVVINAARPRVGVRLEAIEDHFAQRCATVVTVPWDRALEAGGQTSLSALRPATRDALTELAAAVADHFTTQQCARSTRGDRGDSAALEART